MHSVEQCLNFIAVRFVYGMFALSSAVSSTSSSFYLSSLSPSFIHCRYSGKDDLFAFVCHHLPNISWLAIFESSLVNLWMKTKISEPGL